MINLLCIPPLFMMGCHGNDAISHNANRCFSSGQNISHLVGPCKQFGAHKQLSWERSARQV